MTSSTFATVPLLSPEMTFTMSFTRIRAFITGSAEAEAGVARAVAGCTWKPCTRGRSEDSCTSLASRASCTWIKAPWATRRLAASKRSFTIFRRPHTNVLKDSEDLEPKWLREGLVHLDQ